MKILHIISGGDTGGAKTHVINLIKELQKTMAVDLVCFMDSSFTEEARNQKINLEVFKQKTRLDLSAVKKVIDKINREKYDILHCHGARANFISLLLKLKCKTPIVTTIHSDYKLDFQSHFLKNIVYTNVNAFSLKYIDYYIGVSESFRKMMIDRGFPKQRVYAVYNGVIRDNEVDFISRKDFFSKYKIASNGNEIFVGIMGRLHPVKGHGVFLKAAKRAYAENKKLRFLIAGDGEEEGKLVNLIDKLGLGDVTRLLGFIENPFDFFNAIDINTLTSFSESFPYVILEGALCKKPIISSNVGGIGDLVIDGVNGYVFEVDDSMTLSNRMLELAESEEKRRTMGENLYKMVIDRYTVKNMAEQHLKIYEDIIERSKG